MLDSNNFLEIIKQAALDAVEAGEPCDFCFGTVTSDKPLTVLIEQKLQLSAAQLVLTRNVTDYKTSITAGNTMDVYFTGNYEDGGTAPISPPHVHGIGKIQVTVHNELQKGEKVVLIKQKGGQKYLILDRVIEK